MDKNYPIKPNEKYKSLLAGGIFLVVAALNAYELLADPGTADYVTRVLAVGAGVLGLMLLLRPWRAGLRLGDEGIWFCDGVIWPKTMKLATISHLLQYDGLHYAMVSNEGRAIGIQFIFENRDEFLEQVEQLGIKLVLRHRHRKS